MSETTELTVVPAAMLPTILANDVDDILGKLARKVATFKPDVSTAKGRGEMRSLAAEIASSKMDLIRIGKGLTETWRKSTKAVNEECNVLEERMNALRDRVRQQLTDYENAEKARIARHEAALATLVEQPEYGQTETAEELTERLQWLESYTAPRPWEEFEKRAAETLESEIIRTKRLHAAAVQREADAAELAARRAADEERERQEAARLRAEHEAKIAAQAAETARIAAETKASEEAAAAERRAQAEARAAAEKAEAERLRIIREAKEAADRAEQERIAGERREREAQERADAAERARVAAEAKAKADALEAARKAEEARTAAEQKAERDRIAAVEAERKRTADAKTAEDAERQKREANKAHRTKINREALAALILCGLTEQQGVAVVTALAKNEIPHCQIEY